MASFDLDNYVPEAVLEIDNKDQQTLHSQARWEMFINELQNAQSITIPRSKMLESIITEANDTQNQYYDKCHVKTHAKSGGTQFKNSYEKNCK